MTDLQEKSFTYLAEIRVIENYLSLPFRIKLEISRREVKNYQWELKLLSSPATIVQVIGRVAVLKQIYKDKLDCFKNRAKPKDIFDLWYVSQKLGIPYEARSVLKREEFARDLRKYLPKDFWPAIEGLTR